MTAGPIDELTAHLADLRSSRRPVLVVGPSPDVLATVVDIVDGIEVQMLAESAVVEAVTEDFLLASRLADRIEAETLELRVTDRPPVSNLCIGENRMIALVPVGTGYLAMEPATMGHVPHVRDRYIAQFSMASDYGIETPPISRIESTLIGTFDPAVESTFRALVREQPAIRTDQRLDAVVLTLLTGAVHELPFNELTQWAEDMGIASVATFSRVKTTLEDAGAITTEPLPAEVGRPTFRLLLGAQLPADADPAELLRETARLLEVDTEEV